MSSLICYLVSPNTIAKMNWKQYTHRRICSHISAMGRMHAHYIQVSVVLSVIPLLVKLAISITRMKAETLSWSSGCHSFLHDLVHKTGQRYDFKLKQQNNCGKYYLILIKVKKPGMKNRELTQTINRVNSIDESS